MELMNRVITGGYWGAYYLVYVVGMVYLLYHFRREFRFPEAGQADVDTLFVGAAICGTPRGTALFVAIIVEVTGRMVRLIPKAWNKAKDLGRAEGLTEGLTTAVPRGLRRAVSKERDRVQAILAQYARRDPATGELILDRDARVTPAQRSRRRGGLGCMSAGRVSWGV